MNVHSHTTAFFIDDSPAKTCVRARPFSRADPKFNQTSKVPIPGKGMVESGPLNQHYVNEKLSLWLPLVQKGDDVVGIERPRRLPLTIFLRINQLTVSVENCQRRHTLIEWSLVLRGQIIVFLAVVADVHMHNPEILLHEGRDIGLMKCLVKYMAVVAPVPTEDQDHTLMIFLRLGYGFLDFDFGIRVLVIEMQIALESRRHFDHLRVRRRHDPPPATLLLPCLLLIYIAGPRAVCRFQLHGNCQTHDMEPLLVPFFEGVDLNAARAAGNHFLPEIDLRGDVRRKLLVFAYEFRRWIGRVQALKRRCSFLCQ